MNFHDELKKYRAEHLTTESLLSYLENHSEIVLDIPTGVGKTALLKTFIANDKAYQKYDHIIVSLDRHDLMGDFQEVKMFMEGSTSDVFVIQKRPIHLCGSLDHEWSRLEKSGNSLYAKKHICEQRCNQSDLCEWRDQWKNLGKFKLIFCISDYLRLIPNIFEMIKKGNSGKKILLIIDEPRLLMQDMVTEVTYAELFQFKKALVQVYKDISNNTEMENKGDNSKLLEWISVIDEISEYLK